MQKYAQFCLHIIHSRMSLIKSPSDIASLKIGGKHLSAVLKSATDFAKPGISLLELDAFIESEIRARGCTPAFKGFEGFPNSACLSLNEEVVHGIPDDRILKDGDLIGIDVGLWYAQLCSDAAVTVGIGTITLEAQALLDHTKLALKKGLAAVKPFRRVGAISAAIEEVATTYNHGIVRSLMGHGVGHKIHEDPDIPNFGKSGDGILLRPGMVLAIEPMFTNGGGEVYTDVDGWGVITVDRSLSAQFEHNVVVTNTGYEILV
jgi:methionyl aminopeptidase